MSSLRKFFIQYSYFLTGSVLSLIFGLISFPILTRILTKEEYGILGLVTTTMLLSVAVSKAGLSESIVRFYQEYTETPEQRNLFSSTVIVRGAIFSAATALMFVALFPIISKYLKINDKFISCFMIMAVYLFLRSLNTIIYQFLRVNGKIIFINVIGMIGNSIAFWLGLFLFVYVFHKLYGYFVGVIVAESIVSIVLFYWFFSNYKITPSKTSRDLTITLIKFGGPILFTELSYLLLTYIDRYMIVAYLGEAMLGVYSVGYTLATCLSNVIIISLAWAIVPIYVEIYEKEGKEKTEIFLQRAMHYLLIAIIPTIIGYFAVSKELFVTLASEKYAAAATFSPLILIGLLFLGMNNIFNAGLFLKKKSMTIFVIMFFAVIINVALNLILLPKYGVTGAAISILVSCFTVGILSISLSYKYISVKVGIKTVLYHLMLSCIMFFIVKQIEISIVWLGLMIKILIGFLIIIPGVLLREKEILMKIKGIYHLKKGIITS